ncbi:NUC189-domain-containing protein [Suhomyces tanzawaensis NRRL Y-17324]|uniref:NUC189-domain-containing protein n=1 Tax=Suhomyces tanzawaensis NRRL Y-17324 TaxID=984487 RepID=A0A1E4SJC5_9ASCO|nr:NUC189-domain-containing protein [Suhomyces tanzawaensis NRRL Y-17324]ODV79590.1 NUC189-domain-containing protein [Suhomyces tanzawaensis NRRL Y-17324]
MSSGPFICAKFDPSKTFLASGHIALDTHQIKVQSVNPSQSPLNTSFNLDKSSKLTQISWIPSAGEQHILALSLTKGSILIYSPSSNEIITELTTPSHASILDFHFSLYTQSAWSCDNGGSIYEWDVVNHKLLQSFNINDVLENAETINRISSVMYNEKPCLLIGSHSIYLIDISSRQIIKTFPGHIQPINSILPVPNDPDLFLTSAKGDRFINLYSISKGTTRSVFVSQVSVLDMDLGVQGEKSLLTSINENGNLEVFNNPLSLLIPTASSAQQAKKKRRQAAQIQSRPSNGTVKLSRPETEIKNPNDSNLMINCISVSGDSILVTWLENGNVPYFDSIKWIDESGTSLIESDKVVLKSRPNLKPTSHTSFGHDVASAKIYEETHTIVSDGNNYKDIDYNEDEVSETLADKLEKLTTDQQPKKNRTKKKLGTKTGTLTIVLAQSLRNNDHALLETVLSNRDPQVIQNTIKKLDSSLAVILLDKLSEKIQRQASKFDQLNYWLKWIVIIHGTVLASLPNLSIKLANLHSVLIKKANTLPRLLELQGRLNMLYQQNDLKREILIQEYEQDQEDEESDVEYNEDIDDAEAMGIIEEDESDQDIDMDGHDDFEEESDFEEEEDEDLQAAIDLDGPEEEEEE